MLRAKRRGDIGRKERKEVKGKRKKNRISKQVFFSLRPMSVHTHLTNPPPHPLSLYGILHLKGRKFTTINEVLINKWKRDCPIFVIELNWELFWVHLIFEKLWVYRHRWDTVLNSKKICHTSIIVREQPVNNNIYLINNYLLYAHCRFFCRIYLNKFNWNNFATQIKRIFVITLQSRSFCTQRVVLIETRLELFPRFNCVCAARTLIILKLIEITNLKSNRRIIWKCRKEFTTVFFRTTKMPRKCWPRFQQWLI